MPVYQANWTASVRSGWDVVMARKTEVLYARVYVETKNAIDAYADEHGITIAAATDQLIQNGLRFSKQDDEFLDIMKQALKYIIKDTE